MLVVGASRVVTDTAEITDLEQAAIPRWLPEALPYYIAIGLDRISGRCLTNPLS